jgi:hypothetical protein
VSEPAPRADCCRDVRSSPSNNVGCAADRRGPVAIVVAWARQR